MDWGRPVTVPVEGCVAVFAFAQGNHVGFYVGEEGDYVKSLGGNQDDSVKVKRYPKVAVKGYRRLFGGGLRPIARAGTSASPARQPPKAKHERASSVAERSHHRLFLGYRACLGARDEGARLARVRHGAQA